MTTWKVVTLAVGIPLLAAILLVVGFVGCVACSIHHQTTTNISPTSYPGHLKQWQPKGIVAHFPASIPSHATNVRFSETPGFLQGGGHLQLHLVLPTPDVQSLIQTLTTQAKHIYPGGGSFFSQVNSNPGGVPTTTFHTAPGGGGGSFPPDFTFYVLGARHYQGGPNPSWNHGETWGVAINPKSNAVVYWAEDW